MKTSIFEVIVPLLSSETFQNFPSKLTAVPLRGECRSRGRAEKVVFGSHTNIPPTGFRGKHVILFWRKTSSFLSIKLTIILWTLTWTWPEVVHSVMSRAAKFYQMYLKSCHCPWYPLITIRSIIPCERSSKATICPRRASMADSDPLIHNFLHVIRNSPLWWQTAEQLLHRIKLVQ